VNFRALGLIVLTVVASLVAPERAQEVTATPAPARPAPATSETAIATPAASPRPAPAYPIQPATGSVQLALYLLLLIALLGGGFYVMRNGFSFLQPKPKGPRKLDISETKMLGNRQFLIVAEYENRKMLIGVCPGRIDYLCTLSGAEPEFPQITSEEEK